MGEATLTCAGAVEGPVDEAVLRRILADFGRRLHPVHIANGKTNLLRQLPGYNNAARHHPWIVLIDLDHDADCAPPIVRAWLPEPGAQMRFRVAVRAVEAWLLADRETIAAYLAVPVNRVPLNPEGLDSPKRAIVDLARRSRRRAVQQGLAPRDGSGREVGPEYTAQMIRYAAEFWRPEVAARRADSLRRLRLRLENLD